ncbi:MAG: stage V sporulation protein AC [Clostridia bacterium]|nr:stage V sporulation protein AC [Clostridia bacterium]
MDITPQEYRKLAEKSAPRSPVLADCLKAFGVGGTICMLGQAIALAGQAGGLGEKDALFLASLTLVLLSVLLTALGAYDVIAKHAGAGTLVPITGFANAMTAPAIEYKTEGLVMGLGTKMFTIAGPVLVYGVLASVIYGLIQAALTLL